ncbi:hypothetical protein FM114_04480 [Luteococcus japonicus LSP_Lj1]|uniref:Uncharacterized protein n=1 Tax=Luteococcus japonicus LSP_Lj1 TaxID=1255658 RepID=A0A1R4IYF4_9ACTN|nr:hypothetical protein FM114_04480 [Luteococcus japonicus LSP_Lj1]
MGIFWTRPTIDHGRRQTTGCPDEHSSFRPHPERSPLVHLIPHG